MVMRDFSKYDFYILTMPHSGSHMLASALDSHRDIQCKGEYGFRDYADTLGAERKRVKGCITHAKAYQMQNVSVDDVDKFIVLARHDNAAELERLVNGKQFITVTYEDITGNKNIEALPRAISEALCDFLGVGYARMLTNFIKGVGLKPGGA